MSAVCARSAISAHLVTRRSHACGHRTTLGRASIASQRRAGAYKLPLPTWRGSTPLEQTLVPVPEGTQGPEGNGKAELGRWVVEVFPDETFDQLQFAVERTP